MFIDLAEENTYKNRIEAKENYQIRNMYMLIWKM